MLWLFCAFTLGPCLDGGGVILLVDFNCFTNYVWEAHWAKASLKQTRA